MFPMSGVDSARILQSHTYCHNLNWPPPLDYEIFNMFQFFYASLRMFAVNYLTLFPLNISNNVKLQHMFHNVLFIYDFYHVDQKNGISDVPSQWLYSLTYLKLASEYPDCECLLLLVPFSRAPSTNLESILMYGSLQCWSPWTAVGWRKIVQQSKKNNHILFSWKWREPSANEDLQLQENWKKAIIASQ